MDRLSVTIRASDLPEDEKRRRLREVIGMLVHASESTETRAPSSAAPTTQKQRPSA